ncbi:MAG: cation diffusion facilitator family transporter [Bacteroidales bacterium]
MTDLKERAKQAKHVTLTGFFINLVLTVAKLIAGFTAKSGALIADGVHSLSDFVTDLIVLVFIGVSGKERDKDHKYGHGKFETFATMLVSFSLMVVGVGIFWSGFQKIIRSLRGDLIVQPGYIALIVALVSIIAKEGLFWYTLKTGRNISSQAVIANAWHHRSDAFSSIGVAIGIAGAIFLGPSWRILDPIAGILVSFFIVKIAWDLGNPSVSELLEVALPQETEREITDIIADVPGVKAQHNLKTRKIGNTLAIEVHAKVDKELSVEASHDIATQIENALRNKYGKYTHIGVHIEPFYGNPVHPIKS